MPSPPFSSGGISILMTLAPQSASWRTQVGPDRTRVRSSTVNRARALDALGIGIGNTPAGGCRSEATFPDKPCVVHALSVPCLRLRTGCPGRDPSPKVGAGISGGLHEAPACD